MNELDRRRKGMEPPDLERWDHQPSALFEFSVRQPAAACGKPDAMPSARAQQVAKP